jgi:hypothetical protein
MKKFIVIVREVYIQPVLIEAETIDKAIEAVADGEGEIIEGQMEYSHNLNPELWSVEELKEE